MFSFVDKTTETQVNNILTMTFSYVCFKNIVKDKKYVLLGVFIYTLAPYRLINSNFAYKF